MTTTPSARAREAAACNHRIVVCGPYGHQLAHPANCPRCFNLAAIRENRP